MVAPPLIGAGSASSAAAAANQRHLQLSPDPTHPLARTRLQQSLVHMGLLRFVL